jgi:glucose/arabinose dehydrogenase
MHLRRAVLLFAIVLGLAALAASISRPREHQQAQQPAPPTAPTVTPAPERTEPAHAKFAAGGKRETRRVEAGQQTEVVVKSREPGQVDIDGLGLTASAEPVTPARFDVLPSQPGRYQVRFTPAASSRSELVGVLAVRRPSQ